MGNQNYKLVAPDIERLLKYFDKDFLNSSGVRPVLAKAMNPLFDLLEPLEPLDKNNEVKFIWLLIPRGDISDFESFEYVKECDVVKNYQEYEKLWMEDYPLEKMWYRLVIVDSKDRDGKTTFRAVSLGNKSIISVDMNKKGNTQYSDKAAVILCKLILPAVTESLKMLKNGTYNVFVKNNLPYKLRKGVIKRSVLWKNNPEHKKFDFDGLSEKTISTFRSILKSGVNDKTKISRIKEFTANDFFKACELGYKALGYKTEGMSLSEIYMKYSDGRDEGLTGSGYGLNEGPGINFEDARAWDEWYSGHRGGGHPWEIIRGGNSTHVDLFVCHDDEGYYFIIHGKHRQFEAVTFYITLYAAGLPVYIEDADEILARFDGNDFVGIVPNFIYPRYCEDMFPKEYGKIIDFMHIYDEDIELYSKDIIWLSTTEVKLKE